MNYWQFLSFFVVLNVSLLELYWNNGMCSTWAGIHFSGCDRPVSSSFLHFLLNEFVGIDEMLGHSLYINPECFMFPYFVTLFGPFSNRDEQILYFFVVYLHHWDLNFIFFVWVFVFGDPGEYLFARNGHYSLTLCKCTLLAPYPTIEYDFPAPVWP